MDTQQPTQPISDDQELAKVLAGVANDDTAAAPAVEPVAPPVLPPLDPMPPAPAEEAAPAEVAPLPEPAVPQPALTIPDASGELDGVKSQAINELRPLVDRLTLPPEEKFDTYLLLIRSTDDKTLIAPAHEAARAIEDETRRAQALLDIIKEIDFLSGQQAA